MSRELTEALFAEAATRGVTPSELVREFVQQGLAGAHAGADAWSRSGTWTCTAR